MVQGVLIEDGCIVNTNPATGDVISRVPCATPEQVDRMVRDAHDASSSWSILLDTEQRVALLKRGLTILEEHSDRLVNLIVQEMGKPMAQAREEMEGAVDKDDFLRVLSESQKPQTFGNSVVLRQAHGVVVVLSPWNFPVDEILLLALPALACGNTVIVKPSEVTPECGALTVSFLSQVLPPNTLQLAQGDGIVGAQLVSHPSVNMVAMTGSSATGKRILETAAPNMKRLVLELGGKDPMVVFDDADLDQAAKDAVEYSLCNTGQVCCSIERIYVAESIQVEFETRVVELASTYKLGSGMDADVKVGPMVSRLQCDHVASQVSSALRDGAKLLFESGLPSDVPDISSFHPVTVLSNLSNDMDIMRRETFGPVVAISAFDGSESDAVSVANDTEYGLAASVYTADLERARRVASRISCGQVGINCYVLDNMDVACPWVGHKSSGFGFHSGVDGFHQFSLPKTLAFLCSED